MPRHRTGSVAAGLLAFAAWCCLGRADEPRCLVIDAFTSSSDAAAEPVVRAAEAFASERGGVIVIRRFVDKLDEDRRMVEAIAARHGIDPNRLPILHACGSALAGPADPEAARRWLEERCRVEVYTRRGCQRCTTAKRWLPELEARYPGLRPVILDVSADAEARRRLADLVRRHKTAGASVPVFHLCERLVVGFDRGDTMQPRFTRLLDPWTRPCREAVGSDPLGPEAEEEETIDLPWLGRIDAGRLGMPLFTLAIGLVDGFNPCAMWVLLLLLSILVNLRDRGRILAIAGTFVLVSGAAYFAFMAAWLNVFEWIGMLRPVQITLGLLAVAIGLVHVKDFVAFHRGPSLSIPEAAKPGIYARIRRIVTAENLPAAVAGAFVLAVLVNMVELLCTAGLPALYTSILTQRDYSAATRYAYLGLYILAYMFDDALMVAVVVASLSRLRLQETGGRWLKLVSGAVILGLGLVMLFRPAWLEG